SRDWSSDVCSSDLTGLGIDGVQASVVAVLQPGDVVADGFDLPALGGQFRRGNQHGEVRLSAGTGKGGADPGLSPLRVGDAENQHMLGEPALVAGLNARQPQRVALLAEQRVSAVVGGEAANQILFRKVGDHALGGIEPAGAVNTAGEV